MTSLFDATTHAVAAPDASTDEPTWASLGLPQALCEALVRRDIAAPFPIQVATIPDALAGDDLLGRGSTGSGKTLAFGLPLLVRIASLAPLAKHPRAIVLVPTRELAMQVSDALEPLGGALNLRFKTVVGGTSTCSWRHPVVWPT